MDKFATNQLITPSASPPVSRSLRPAPPVKRKRFASRSASSLSHVADEPVFDLHSARRDSSLRVLDVWSQLAERYTRRLDEDDIVDLKDITLVKDRGVMRRSSQYILGCFGDGDEPLNHDASSEGAVDDDFDELDAFAIEADISDEIKQVNSAIEPVQVMNPADAEDLRDFLEAEERRKELCGDEADVSSDEVESQADELADFIEDSEDELEERLDEPAFPMPHDNEDLSPQEDDHSEIESQSDDLQLLERQAAMRELPIALVDEGSDDELGGWDINEGNTIYQFIPDHSVSDSSEIEILDYASSSSPIKPGPSRSLSTSSPAPKIKSRSRPKAPSNKKSDAVSKPNPPPEAPEVVIRQSRPPPDVVIQKIPVKRNSPKGRKRKRVASLDYSETVPKKDEHEYASTNTPIPFRYPTREKDDIAIPRASSYTARQYVAPRKAEGSVLVKESSAFANMRQVPALVNRPIILLQRLVSNLKSINHSRTCSVTHLHLTAGRITILIHNHIPNRMTVAPAWVSPHHIIPLHCLTPSMILVPNS
jgi:Centromere protein Scm3